MLSQLDNIIFPDSCEVIEVASQRFVYPIFKNGHTSLMYSGFRVLDMSEIHDLTTVEIFVREPIERFFSGIDSWIAKNEDLRNLDRDTLIYIATNNLFINRHYSPQFHWLVNLKRFTNAKIKINSMKELSTVTSLHLNLRQQKVEFDIDKFPKVAFYMQIDKVLTEVFLGETVEFKDIVSTIKELYPDAYDEIIQRSINICNVLV